MISNHDDRTRGLRSRFQPLAHVNHRARRPLAAARCLHATLIQNLCRSIGAEPREFAF